MIKVVIGKQMNRNDEILTYAITDNKNFLEKTINLNQEIKGILFSYGSYRQGVGFIKFLRNNYTKKEIIELFESINTNTIESGLARYTIQIFRRLSSYENFKKVNNNFIELHGEFTRLESMEDKCEKVKSPETPFFPVVNNVSYYGVDF